MAENKNWLAQKGHKINDNEFVSLGITQDVIAEGNVNKVMLDRVHAENVAGYIEQGFSEIEAKKKADIRRSQAVRAAKENGLTL